MTNNPIALAQRYRTIMIILARHHADMIDKSARIQREADTESSYGRKNGLLCHANVIRKNAARLKEILNEDRALLVHLFGTANLNTIAGKTIKAE